MAEKIEAKSLVAEKLLEIQVALKAPKSQFNSFGKYNYRNCEDILEAAKPLLAKAGLTLMVSDEVIMLGNHFYIKATATIFIEPERSLSVSAYARESEDKKGMDSAQITGSTSSYARKYALNGLFLIDDTKDADGLPAAQENTKKTAKSENKDEKEKPRVIVDTDGTKLLYTLNGYMGIAALPKKTLIDMLASGKYEEAREEIIDAINVNASEN